MRRHTLAAAAAAIIITGCSSAPANNAATTTATARTSHAARATPSPTPKPPPPPPPPPHVRVTHVYTPDGSRISVAVFSGTVKYVLHNGSGDPGSAASGLVTAGPAVGGSERHALLAAFNGGFKLSAGAGGYMQEGHVIAQLLSGYTSLVIDHNGRARITVWPSGSSGAYSVRQNLRPLVLDGRPTSSAYGWSVWGATLGGGPYVARSAIGEDSRGDIIYVGSMSAVPIDLAKALVKFGARIGMELDINPEWVQLDVASHPGGSLRASVYGQQRPSDQYLSGWTRDFVTVLAG